MEWMHQIIWNPFLIIFFFIVGIIIAIKIRFAHVRKIKELPSMFTYSSTTSTISSMQALSTNLAACLGTGNIVGVSSAIVLGGPGTIFWMWISALIGGALKYAEAYLAVLFHETNQYGERVGGPMYYMQKGLNRLFKKNFSWVGILFAILCIFASFGMGNMVQANAVVDGLMVLNNDRYVISLVLMIVVGFVVSGGIKRISRFTECLIPIITFTYIAVAIIIILINWQNLISAISLIFQDAFTANALAGGLWGTTIRYGIARGIFTNEAGMGSSSIVHAASGNTPINEGVISAFSVYIDTLVMCTITALVILVTNAHFATGNLTLIAFSFFGSFGTSVVNTSMVLFGFATIIGWFYFGSKSFEFIFGIRYRFIYQIIYIAIVFVGGVSQQALLWEISDIFNALMLILNISVMLLLLPFLHKSTVDDFIK